MRQDEDDDTDEAGARAIAAWRRALASGDEERAGRLGLQVAIELVGLGLYHQSLALANEHHRRLPGDPYGLQWLGYASFLTGARDRALPLLERALAAARARGLQASDLAPFLDVLGRIRQATGDLPGARAALEESLRLLRASSEPDDRQACGIVLIQLASLLQDLGDLAGAWGLLEESQAIWTEAFGTDPHPFKATCLHNQGVLLLIQGKLVEAKTRLEQGLAMRIEAFGTDLHPDVVSSLNVLARVLERMGLIVAAVETRVRMEDIEAELNADPSE